MMRGKADPGRRTSLLFFVFVVASAWQSTTAGASRLENCNLPQVTGVSSPANVGELPFGTFETPRLVIRPVTRKDSPDLVRVFGNPKNQEVSGDYLSQSDLHEFSSLPPPSKGAPWDVLFFSVVSRDSGQVIGFIQMLRADTQPAANSHILSYGTGPKGYATGQRAFIGVSLDEAYWGQGLMTEAVTEAAKYGQTHFGVSQFFGETLPTNTRAQGLMAKAGFRPIGSNGQFLYFELPVPSQVRAPPPAPPKATPPLTAQRAARGVGSRETHRALQRLRTSEEALDPAVVRESVLGVLRGDPAIRRRFDDGQLSQIADGILDQGNLDRNPRAILIEYLALLPRVTRTSTPAGASTPAPGLGAY